MYLTRNISHERYIIFESKTIGFFYSTLVDYTSLYILEHIMKYRHHCKYYFGRKKIIMFKKPVTCL